MIIYKRAADLNSYLREQRTNSKKIGFVPTMGALHEGHLSLIRRSISENDLTVCSIFVNPTQFNNPDDFKQYPITIERDLELLLTVGCNVQFLPSATEIYPPDHTKKHYDLGQLEHLLEGAHRPGHFQGVCEVVDRLLELTEPHTLYLGQKDYQQCMIVRRLLELTGRNSPELKIGATLREADGLAMSSRNLRLSPADRQKAPALFQTLKKIKCRLPQQPIPQLEQEAADILTQQGFAVDYVAICNAQTLQPATSEREPKIALVAATINGIRLIDNLPLN